MSESESPESSSAQPLSAKQCDWLNKESALWVGAGLISGDQANKINARYSPSVGTSWVVYLLSSMGAIVFGLGIILLFAYNWSEITKTVKLAIIFGALLVTHGAALFLRLKGSTHTNLIEAFHMLGTMMLGAGIWLVAQIYHIDEHYPTAFALWGAGALLLAWALPSVLQALLACILLTFWGFAETADFDSSHYFALAAIALGVLPLAWSLKSQTLLFAGLVGMMTLSFTNLLILSIEELAVYLAFSVSTLLLSAAYLSRQTAFPKSAAIFRLLGFSLYGLLLFILSMHGVSIDFFDISIDGHSLHLAISVMIIAMAGIVASITYDRLGSKSLASLIEQVLVLSSLVVCLLSALEIFSENRILGLILFNIILTSHCILLIVIGIDRLSWKNVLIGALGLSTLIFWQFGDLFHSLLMRSAAFLALGFILFLIGHIYAKAKQGTGVRSHA